MNSLPVQSRERFLSKHFRSIPRDKWTQIKWSTAHPERNRYQRQVFKAFLQGALDSKGAVVVIDKLTEDVIGSSRYSSFDPAKKQVEVGYTFLAKKYWGKGYNTEMKRLMLSHAFRYVDQVRFYVGENNIRSRAIEKIGAKFIEQFQRQPKEGPPYLAVVYGIEKTRFSGNIA